MNRFHDKDFDGIVLRIPEWFIDMNGLGSQIKSLHKALQKCKLSMYHPDHKTNLYELENYKDKKKIIQVIADDRKKKEEERQLYAEKLFAGEIFELQWVNKKEHFDLSDADFRFKDESIEKENIFLKRSIKGSFKNWFSENIKTLDDFHIAAKSNCNIGLLVDLEKCDDDFIDFYDFTLYIPNQGWDQLGIGYKRLYVKTEWRKLKSGAHGYTLNRLIRFDDGCLGYENGNKNIRFEGFEKIGNLKLFKK